MRRAKEAAGIVLSVASGKGGTGKTTIAASLALSLAAGSDLAVGGPVTIPPLFLDCDVEAPNAHLFLRPSFEQRREIGILIPQVDDGKCTHCGTCAEVCQFHAIAVLGKQTLVFPQLCHGCGSCTRMCPEGAIREVLKPTGFLERGPGDGGVDFARGLLDIGEPMAVPVIRELKRWALPEPGQVVILDAPPGTSCPVVETVRETDFLLLVTEPTPFGLHDLRLAAELARELDLPAGVVINRWDEHTPQGGYGANVEAFCREQALPVLMRIPFERRIAEGIARGLNLVEIHPEMIPAFQGLFARISETLGVGQKVRTGWNDVRR